MIKVKLFANNPKYVSFNSETGQLDLSPILNWYGEDWDERYPHGGYLRWIADLAGNDELKSQLESTIAGNVERNFVKYDWSLNSQKEPGSTAGHSSGEFGSGSIQTE